MPDGPHRPEPPRETPREASRDASGETPERAGSARLGRESGLLLLSSLLFCCSDVFIKLLTQRMPLGEFMVLRALACSVLFLAVMPRAERHAGNRFVLMRSLFEAVSVTCFILALQALPNATVTSIYMTGPVFTICVAAALGMTRLSWRLVSSVAIAFAGVLLVALPREAGLTEAVVLAFASAVLVAGRDLVTRNMPAGIPSLTVALVTMAGVGLAGAAFSPWGGPWILLPPDVAAMLLLGAMFTAGGNYLIIVAYRTGDPGLMSVLRYASIPMAMVVGGIVFGHVPYPLQLLGAGMVILGGTIAMGRGRSGG